MLQNGNIDLVREKIELDAFLSVCLEKADSILGPLAQKPEEKDVMPAPEPERAGPGEFRQSYPGLSGIGGPPVEGLREPAPDSEPQPRPLETVPIPQPEKTETREKSIYETFAERPADAAPPPPAEQAVELPKSHFSPAEKLSMPAAQLSALERELALEKQQMDREGTASAADIADRSALRKPSKNLAAMEFARKQAEQRKRMHTLFAVLAAAVIILGIVWFVPFQKIADSLLGSGKGTSVQVDSKAAGAKDAAAKKISRD